MRARIFCKVGELKGVSAQIGAEATLGRDESATVRLPDSKISSTHARIVYDAEARRYVLEDLGSTNGTALDGVRVRGRERLGHLHVITLAGEHDLIFQDLDLCAQRRAAAGSAEMPPSEDTAVDEAFPVIPERLAEPEPAPAEVERTRVDELPVPMPDFLAGRADDAAAPPVDDRTRIDALPAPLPELLASPAEPPEPEPTPDPVSEDQLTELFLGELDAVDGYGLEVRLADAEVEVLPLHEGENVVGRGALASLRINHPEISRRHALLMVTADRVTMRDLGSSNHTFLNDERVLDTVDVPLEASIRFGAVEARLVPWSGDSRARRQP